MNREELLQQKVTLEKGIVKMQEGLQAVNELIAELDKEKKEIIYKRKVEGYCDSYFKTHREMINYLLDCIDRGDIIEIQIKEGYSYGSNETNISLLPQYAPQRIIITRRVHDGCHQKVEEKEVWNKI